MDARFFAFGETVHTQSALVFLPENTNILLNLGITFEFFGTGNIYYKCHETVLESSALRVLSLCSFIPIQWDNLLQHLRFT